MKKKYTLVHQNVQSIGNCLNQLDLFVNELDVTFLTITEHWKSKDELLLYKFSNFNLISSFSWESGKYGGCAIYCRSGIACRERNDFDCSIPFVFEEVIIICINRPCSAPIETFFEKMHNISCNQTPLQEGCS